MGYSLQYERCHAFDYATARFSEYIASMSLVHVYVFWQLCFSGKWFPLKMFVFKILLFLRKRKQKAAVSKSGGAGYGIKSRSSIDEMDCLQPLCDDEMVSSVSRSVSESNHLSLRICPLFMQHRLV